MMFSSTPILPALAHAFLLIFAADTSLPLSDRTNTMSSSLATFQTVILPGENTFAVMVHKNYYDRVCDYLLAQPNAMKNWERARGVCGMTTKNLDESASRTQRILATTGAVGVRRNRQGCYIALLPQLRDDCFRPAMIRQHLTLVARITHQSTLRSSNLSNLAPTFWGSLCSSHGFDIEQNHSLRVDVYPRDRVEEVCLALQKAADPSAIIDDCFEGPIPMTMSASKCSHRLYVIVGDEVPPLAEEERTTRNAVSSSTTKEGIAAGSTVVVSWGVDERRTREDHMKIQWNQLAQAELNIVPCDCRTGAEDVDFKVDPTTPLSRAYYKLEQVWNDYSDDLRNVLDVSTATGLDLGAAPGGWTQALVHAFGLAHVVAVDPAALGIRISSSACVSHLADVFENVDLANHEAAPYSVVVCDASMLYMDLLPELYKLSTNHMLWSLPCVWVVTLKLPYKLVGSIQTHVNVINRRIADDVERMATAMFPNEQESVSCSYNMVHLMANSISERTLIMAFHKR